jgi:hypothetical protein
MQNAQLVTDNGPMATDTLRAFHLLRAHVIVGMLPESRRNSATTQLPKPKHLASMLDNVAQARDVSRLLNSRRNPFHKQSQLSLLFLAILN